MRDRIISPNFDHALAAWNYRHWERQFRAQGDFASADWSRQADAIEAHGPLALECEVPSHTVIEGDGHG